MAVAFLSDYAGPSPKKKLRVDQPSNDGRTEGTYYIHSITSTEGAYYTSLIPSFSVLHNKVGREAQLQFKAS